MTIDIELEQFKADLLASARELNSGKVSRSTLVEIPSVAVSAFVRTAAKEKARELLDLESRITMTAQDSQSFITALNGAFMPNSALQKAMDAAHEVNRA
ncbi:MAG: DUF1778 domain-containing protein [Betaproteobacteria bacterium]